MNSQGVTLVIPTLDREAYVLDVLENLPQQTFRPIEVLIVDQSNQESPKIREFKFEGGIELSYYHVKSFRGLPEARNFGWQNAQFETIVYIDDDVVLASNFIQSHVDILSKDGVGAVAGGIIELNKPNPKKGPTGKFNWFSATPSRGFDREGAFEVDHFPGGNFSCLRSTLKEAGGFDEQLNVGAALYEETDASLRIKKLGKKIVFDSATRLQHIAASSGGCREPDLRSYVYSLAHNRTLLIRRHIPIFFWGTAIARLLSLISSYAVSARNPQLIVEANRGLRKALLVDSLKVKCTEWGKNA